MNISTRLPAEFLHADRFMTSMDGPANSDYRREQYGKALKLGQDSAVVHVAINDVWSATLKSGASLVSYAKLGSHAGTAALLQGFLDSGVRIIVHRAWAEGLVHYELDRASEREVRLEDY
jgi:predicted kinase